MSYTIDNTALDRCTVDAHTGQRCVLGGGHQGVHVTIMGYRFDRPGGRAIAPAELPVAGQLVTAEHVAALEGAGHTAEAALLDDLCDSHTALAGSVGEFRGRVEKLERLVENWVNSTATLPALRDVADRVSRLERRALGYDVPDLAHRLIRLEGDVRTLAEALACPSQHVTHGPCRLPRGHAGRHEARDNPGNPWTDSAHDDRVTTYIPEVAEARPEQYKFAQEPCPSVHPASLTSTPVRCALALWHPGPHRDHTAISHADEGVTWE